MIKLLSGKNPKTVFVICTGSPGYDVPSDLLEMTGVSDQVYRKPVNHMEKLENTLLRLISEIENQRIWYDED